MQAGCSGTQIELHKLLKPYKGLSQIDVMDSQNDGATHRRMSCAFTKF